MMAAEMTDLDAKQKGQMCHPHGRQGAAGELGRGRLIIEESTVWGLGGGKSTGKFHGHRTQWETRADPIWNAAWERGPWMTPS